MDDLLFENRTQILVQLINLITDTLNSHENCTYFKITLNCDIEEVSTNDFT